MRISHAVTKVGGKHRSTLSLLVVVDTLTDLLRAFSSTATFQSIVSCSFLLNVSRLYNHVPEAIGIFPSRQEGIDTFFWIDDVSGILSTLDEPND